jgi:hypothetical protein
MLQVKMVGRKSVYIVASHHEVLEAWAEVRKGMDTAPDLISIDEHTDTLEPFQSYVSNLEEGDERPEAERAAVRQALVDEIEFRNSTTVKQAVARLRHDEHIQAATRSGIIDIAFVISIEGAQTYSEEEKQQVSEFRLGKKASPVLTKPRRYRLRDSRILVIPFGCHTDCTSTAHDAECHRKLSDQILETCLLERQIEIASEMSISIRNVALRAKPFILDIDLDTFHTYQSLSPKDPSLFHELISGASAITIAIEREWTSALWLEQSAAPIDDMLGSLYRHIEKSSDR